MHVAHGCPVPESLAAAPGLLRRLLRRLVPLLLLLAALAALVGVSIPFFQDNLQCSTRPGWLMPLPRSTPPPDRAGTPPRPGALTPTALQPVSTFAADVDTAALTELRGAVARLTLPPPAWLRPEEVVNGLDYEWAPPGPGADVAIHAAGAPSPWAPRRHLLTVALRLRDLGPGGRPPLHLTLLLDRSGSMSDPTKLDLTRSAVATLLSGLTRDDTVAVVAYDDAAEILLPPTPAVERDRIVAAAARAEPRGSTNLGAGLEAAYGLAHQGAGRPGLHRVVLFTDGVANAGVTDPTAQLGLIRGAVDEGVDLLAVGVGVGEYGDPTLEGLARQGNGVYVYLDDERQVRRIFRDRLMTHLVTLARDMRVQVTFDPSTVTSWRQVGYEDRRMRPQDFRNDEHDAGEVGPGHAVTAVYELELAPEGAPGPLGRVAVRWLGAADGAVSETSRAIPASVLSPTWAEAPRDLRLAANAAIFTEELARALDTGGGPCLDVLAADAATTAAAPDATVSSRDWAELAQRAAALAGAR